MRDFIVSARAYARLVDCAGGCAELCADIYETNIAEMSPRGWAVRSDRWTR